MGSIALSVTGNLLSFRSQTEKPSIMDYRYYQNQFPKAAEMKAEIVRQQASWFRHLALLASAILGIHAALGNNDNVFSSYWVADLLLLLCILFALVASFFEIFVIKRSLSRFLEELSTAAREGRSIDPVFSGKPLFFSIAEVIAVLSFVASLILLLIG